MIPYTLGPKPFYPKPKPYALSPKPSTLNSKEAGGGAFELGSFRPRRGPMHLSSLLRGWRVLDVSNQL